MKKTLCIVLALSTLQAFALDSLCVTKQKNAASYTLAQEIGSSVQEAEVISFERRGWTRAMKNNNGSDNVTVRIGNRINRGMTIKTYNVSAKQIDSSNDCTIQSSTEVED